MPRPKSKVKFSKSQKPGTTTTTTTPGSGDGKPSKKEMKKVSKKDVKKKTSKSLTGQSELPTSDGLEEESYEDTSPEESTLQQQQPQQQEIPSAPVQNFGLSEPVKTNWSDGSISDVEIPPLKWKSTVDGPICPIITAGNNEVGKVGCGVGVKMTLSQKVSPCIKSDNQDFATTDYVTSAALAFIPQLIHPINGQVSTFTRHREFTDYLRSSGCLRLFGTCIISVYRMKSWPRPENLMEQILNSMGYQTPFRKQVVDLTNRKQALILKLKLLTKERCQLLETQDKYQNYAARYELLDQDQTLPPRPEDSPLKMDLMNETFKNLQFVDAGRDYEDTTKLKVILTKPAPISDTLPIPYHDKRLLF